MLDVKCFKEIKITVPWGYIAGKAWGESSNPMILMLHGLMDNAATFNRLIPHLPDCHYYVSIDLPGHGFSSHFPPHLPLQMPDFLLALHLILAHFDRNKYTIIGHSYGARIASIYAQLYPEKVEKLVLFDAVVSYPILPENYCKNLRNKITNLLKIENRSPMSYTYDEVINRITKGRLALGFKVPLTKVSAEQLSERAVAPSENQPGKFTFTFDQRLKYLIEFGSDANYIVQVLKHSKIQCPTLVIFTYKFDETLLAQLIPIKEELSKIKNIKIYHDEGCHDEHNENPEKIASYVTDFLNNQHAKL